MKKTIGELLKEAFNTNVDVGDDAPEGVTVNKYDMAKPDNWAEMSKEDQMSWEEKHMVKNAQEPAPEPKLEPKPAAKPETLAPVGKNVVWLNSLIDEIGGQDAFKALLLGAVQAVEVMQNQEETERQTILAQIVTNSGGMLTEEEMKDFELPVLRKMAKAMLPMQVNFGPMGGRTIITNKIEDVAEMPDIFKIETWKDKEA